MTKPHAEVITKEKGTIQLNSVDNSYIIVPDDDPGTRYGPTNLSAEFKKNGLRVLFSGKVGTISPGERLTATPLELTKIEVLE